MRCTPSAAIASTCTGKPTPGTTLGAVSLFPSLPSRVVSRLEPGDAACPGHVQQYSAADDAIGGRGDGQLGRPGVADDVGWPVVVEPAVIDDVAEGVDVGVGVAMDVHADLVHGEGEPIVGCAITGLGHLVPGRLGVVGCHAVLDGAGD